MRAMALTFILAGSLLASSVLAQSPSQTNTAQLQPALIDYAGFSQMTAELMAYRQSRLVSKDEFWQFAGEPDTIILDTRSKAAFDQAHIDGAVHLNFSDFTEEKLAEIIGEKNRKILIYCNNNFSDNVAPFLLKRIELALNIPTFINLYGYGYENIFELGDTVSIHDPDMKIVGTFAQ